MFVQSISSKMHPKPKDLYLISDGMPFRLDGLDNTIQRLQPHINEYELTQPDPKYRKIKIKLPRELVNRILAHLQLAYLKNKEFGSAMLLQLVDRHYQTYMYLQWINPRAGYDCKQRHGVCLSRPIARFFYFAHILFDYAYDMPFLTLQINPHSEDENSDSEEEIDLAVPDKHDIPVIAFHHPYSFSCDGIIKPHHLVARAYNRQETTWRSMHQVMAFPGLWIDGFDYDPTVAYTGTRVCDVVVLDAVCRAGIYEASQTVHPVFLRIDTELGVGSTEWKGKGRWHWERLAILVKTAFNGADLYMVDNKGRSEKVL